MLKPTRVHTHILPTTDKSKMPSSARASAHHGEFFLTRGTHRTTLELLYHGIILGIGGSLRGSLDPLDSYQGQGVSVLLISSTGQLLSIDEYQATVNTTVIYSDSVAFKPETICRQPPKTYTHSRTRDGIITPSLRIQMS